MSDERHDCGCGKAKAELEEFLHRELSDEAFAEIEQHLAGCEDCSAEHLVGLTLTKKVRTACREQAPEELRTIVRLRIQSLRG